MRLCLVKPFRILEVGGSVLSLPAGRGLPDEELSKVAGIPGTAVGLDLAVRSCRLRGVAVMQLSYSSCRKLQLLSANLASRGPAVNTCT